MKIPAADVGYFSAGGDGSAGAAVTPQSVKDSLADAETLRRFAFERRPRKSWAHANAAKLRRTLAGIGFWDNDYTRLGVDDATAWAHAAFRAVPGLRGDK